MQIVSSKGDINNDGLVSLLDMEQLLITVLNHSELTDFEFWAGDLNYNFDHTIIDILYLIDLID